LLVREAEQTFLEDWVAAVPQGQRHTEPRVAVGNAPQPILSPAIGADVRLLEREIVPGVAVGAIVLSDRPPLPLREIRSPEPPACESLLGLTQPFRFRALRGHGKRSPGTPWFHPTATILGR